MVVRSYGFVLLSILIFPCGLPFGLCGLSWSIREILHREQQNRKKKRWKTLLDQLWALLLPSSSLLHFCRMRLEVIQKQAQDHRFCALFFSPVFLDEACFQDDFVGEESSKALDAGAPLTTGFATNHSIFFFFFFL
jgi:hypothetical protein